MLSNFSNKVSLDSFSRKKDCFRSGPEFRQIIDATPLVSVDLLVRNGNNEILLGKRLNRPAQGFWFVPGGRIRKNEIIADAISRVARSEIGIELKRTDGNLIGAFDHIYEDNYWGDAEVNTHYVVLAFSFYVASTAAIYPDDQHAELNWWAISDILQSSEVHVNTKAYCTHQENP